MPLAGARGWRDFPTAFTELLACHRTNIPYLTCGVDTDAWGVGAVLDKGDAEKTCRLMECRYPGSGPGPCPCAVLSLFPHRGSPQVIGLFFEALAGAGIRPLSLATTPSSISAVIREGEVDRAAEALFGPFQFGPFRTPADWRLARKGKEALYREVVASYQEKRPKVYGLHWRVGQELVRVILPQNRLDEAGALFVRLSGMKLPMAFLTTSPSSHPSATLMTFTLPRKNEALWKELVEGAGSGPLHRVPGVAAFAMNGPHFGERYGIASELLHAFEQEGVRLLALGCSIASVTGVVREEDVDRAVKAIQARFEVPAVLQET